MTSLMWFRDDLRLSDNQALTRAAEAATDKNGSKPELVAVVLDEPAYPGTRPLGGATHWWRERSLYALAQELASRGVKLLRATGDARTVIPRIATRLAPIPSPGPAATTARCAKSMPRSKQRLSLIHI